MSTRVGRPTGFAVLATLVGAIGLVGAPVALAAAPANDVYSGRITIPSLPYSNTQDTSEATTDADDSELNTCGAPATDASVWYEFAGTDENVEIDVSGSDYSAGVLVGTGAPGSFSLVACGPGSTAFFAASGTTYAILVIDDQLNEDNLNGGAMSISAFVILPPSISSFTVNSSAKFLKDGSATVSGTINCSNADFVEVDVTLTEVVGRLKITGFGGSFDSICDGTDQSWSANVSSDTGIYKGGKGAVSADAFACNPLDCAFEHVDKTVNIRK